MLLSMRNLLAWMAITLGSILEPLGLFWSLLGRLWVACGLYWVRQGAQMSLMTLLCGREHQLRAQGDQKAACGGSRFDLLKRPVDPCGFLLGGALAPIEELLIRYCTIQP